MVRFASWIRNKGSGIGMARRSTLQENRFRVKWWHEITNYLVWLELSQRKIPACSNTEKIARWAWLSRKRPTSVDHLLCTKRCESIPFKHSVRWLVINPPLHETYPQGTPQRGPRYRVDDWFQWEQNGFEGPEVSPAQDVSIHEVATWMKPTGSAGARVVFMSLLCSCLLMCWPRLGL